MNGPGWCIRAFSRATSELEESIELDGASIDDVRTVFREPAENPMLDSYPVGQREAKELGRFLRDGLDFSKYEYFVEYKSQ